MFLLLPLLLIPPTLAVGAEGKDGSFKTSDGVKLHYLEAGSGPAIFFEPGWSMPAWIWDPQFKYFAEHFHVVALDPRSQGDSDKPTEGNSCERRAQDIKELLEHLKLDHVVLVGWSLGVPALLTYAAQFGGSRLRTYVPVARFTRAQHDTQFIT